MDKWYALKDGMVIREFEDRKKASKFYELMHRNGVRIEILDELALGELNDKLSEELAKRGVFD